MCIFKSFQNLLQLIIITRCSKYIFYSPISTPASTVLCIGKAPL